MALGLPPGFMNGSNVAGGGGPGDVQTTFVFRPGGVAMDNVYTSWAALYAAFSVVDGPKWVVIDDSIAPAVVPAGAYDFTDAVLWGSLVDSIANTDLFFADGATITNLTHVGRALSLINTGTTPTYPFSAAAQQDAIHLEEGSALAASGTAPFLSIDGATSQMVVVLDLFSELLNLGFEAIDLTVAGALLVLAQLDNSQVAADTIRGIAGTTWATFKDASSITSATQTNFAGASVTQFTDLSTQVDYTVAEYAGLTNVDAALDVAALVKDGIVNPNAVVTGRRGYLYRDTVALVNYINVDGAMAWDVI